MVVHAYVQLVMMSVLIHVATYLNEVLFERVLDHGKPLQFTIWMCIYMDVYCSESLTCTDFSDWFCSGKSVSTGLEC